MGHEIAGEIVQLGEGTGVDGAAGARLGRRRPRPGHRRDPRAASAPSADAAG